MLWPVSGRVNGCLPYRERAIPAKVALGGELRAVENGTGPRRGPVPRSSPGAVGCPIGAPLAAGLDAAARRLDATADVEARAALADVEAPAADEGVGALLATQEVVAS
jgi:hypothetical protein